MTWKTWWERLENRPVDDDCIEWMMDVLGFDPVLLITYGVIVAGSLTIIGIMARRFTRPLPSEN